MKSIRINVRMRYSIRAAVASFTVALLALLTACESSAQIIVNGPGTYIVEAQSHWPAGSAGFRFARVKITEQVQTAPLSERAFQVVVSSRSAYGRREKSVTVVPLVIKAGNKSATADVYIPNTIGGHSYSNVRMFVEKAGGNLKMDEGDLHTYGLSTSNDDGRQRLNVLLITPLVSAQVTNNSAFDGRKISGSFVTPWAISDTALPDIGVLKNIYNNFQRTQQNSGMMIASAAALPNGVARDRSADISNVLASPHMHAAECSDLPESWIGLTGVDVILIPLTEIQRLNRLDSPQLEMLRTWVAAGGFLVTYNNDEAATGDGSKTANVETAFENAGFVRNSIAGRQPPSRSKWFSPGVSILNVDKVYSSGEPYRYYGQNENDAVDEFLFEQPFPGTQTDWMEVKNNRNEALKSFIINDYQAGSVCYVADNMTAWSRERWVNLLNSANLRKDSIAANIGTYSTSGVPDFNMAIEGVGKPPFRMFQLLICTFLFTIGPFAYSYLRRRNRTQLLFVVVPLLSLAACVGLLLFATFSDGFQTRGRVRSVTQLDQVNGSAIIWSRHSLYRGIQPAQYNMKIDEAAFLTKSTNNRRAVYDWSEPGVAIAGGDARPRMPHQISAVRPFKTRQGLGISVKQDGTVIVKNNFETKVHSAWLRIDPASESLIFISDVEPGATVTGVAMSLVDCHTASSEVMHELSSDVVDEFLSLGDYEDYYYNTSKATDLDYCGRMLQTLKAGFVESQLSETRSYIAILEQFTEVTEPGENIDYRNRINIVHGKW